MAYVFPQMLDITIGLDDDAVSVRNILVSGSEAVIVFHKFLKRVSYFIYPLQSSIFRIFQVSDLSSKMFSKKLLEF